MKVPPEQKLNNDSNADSYSVCQRSSKPHVIGIFRFCRTPQNEKIFCPHTVNEKIIEVSILLTFSVHEKNKNFKNFFLSNPKSDKQSKKALIIFLCVKSFCPRGKRFPVC
jgi:hypothetical protein